MDVVAQFWWFTPILCRRPFIVYRKDEWGYPTPISNASVGGTPISTGYCWINLLLFLPLCWLLLDTK
jgi:hypothetical protein